jgi:hypothetical protein
MRDAMDQVRNIGISGSTELFWQITQAKDSYIKPVGVNRMMNINEDTPDISEAKKKIQKLCATCMSIT